jgi:hypothetical protein
MAVALILVWALFQGCIRGAPETRHTAVDARYSLLIASDASAFKDTLRGRVVAHFAPFSHIAVVSIHRLKAHRARHFDAVLIIDTCLGWSRFNPSMKSFLDAVADPGRVVLFMTVDDVDWTYAYQGVDAITAASRVEDADQVAGRLILALEAILQR